MASSTTSTGPTSTGSVATTGVVCSTEPSRRWITSASIGVRTHTVTGFFAAPVHGGNAGKAGWQLVQYDDSLHHAPPFGYYDALPGSTSR